MRSERDGPEFHGRWEEMANKENAERAEGLGEYGDAGVVRVEAVRSVVAVVLDCEGTAGVAFSLPV
jgi:hypothetical protein